MRDRNASPPKPAKTNLLVRRATEAAVSVLETVARSRLHVRGCPKIPRGPVLFVSNHFTRSETFLLPWMIQRVTGRRVSILAWHGLFRGSFGAYLESVGARSTREPGIKKRIVEELASGEADWLIYPEGEMVKNKCVWEKGKLHLHTEEQAGPHHTGAILFALQAQRRRSEAGLLDPVRIVPMNVTYHPIRPAPNALFRAARKLFGPLPSRIEEELLVEGSFYFEGTDIDVVFGKPIAPADWAAFVPEGQKLSRSLLARMTTRLMQEVYALTVRNLDHMVCATLPHLPAAPRREDDLARGMFLAAREAESTSGGHWHATVGSSLLDALSGVASAPLEDILSLAEREGVCTRSGGEIAPSPDGARDMCGHVRLHRITGVIANEIAPDRVLVRSLVRWSRLDAPTLRTKSAEALERLDLEVHGSETGADGQIPRWIAPPDPRGTVVLSHGYLASPEETTPLALHLAAHGWACYLVRLAGHGTSPEQLSRTHRAEWWRSFQRGLAIARCRHPDLPLVVAGFSMGSLFALRAAAELVHPPRGLIAVNAPIRLANRASLFAPLLDTWNRAAHGTGLRGLALDTVPNSSEFPGSNYGRNPVRSLHQMELAISETEPLLERIRAPTLIVQGDRDPVVRPESGSILLERIASPSRSLVWWNANRHGILRGEGSTALHVRIADWLEHI